ncbi:MAG: hypothetical protein LBB94_03825 [Clostridiales bacterium]|nr:hypothetical protein [Clostridiales bacterium]
MSAFKEQIENDLNAAFFNPELDEFISRHNINGKDMIIVLDEDELIKRRIGKVNDYAAGVYEGDLLFYVREAVYGGKRPDIGEHMKYDGVIHRVTDFQSDMGMFTIVLAKNDGRRR